jgi:Ca-activated chloride channel family protein
VNSGITNPAELSRHAAELLARGVVTTTLGIGDGYDETLLASIAEHGGGRVLDAENAEDISTVLLAEIDASASTCLDAVKLTIGLPHGVQAEPLGLSSATRTLSGIELRVGPLLAGQYRSSVIALRLPRGETGTKMVFPVSVDGREPGTGNDITTLSAKTRITYAQSSENSAQLRDVATSEIVAQAWHAQILRRLAELNRDRAHGEAQHYLKGQFRYFTRYAEGLPTATALISNLELLLRNIGRDWSERTRKEMVYASRRTIMSDRDFRGGDRATWADRLMSDG